MQVLSEYDDVVIPDSEPAAPLRPDRSKLRIDSGWPARPPEFPELTTTDELRVPLSSHMLTEVPAGVRGTVHRGERLLDHAAHSSHLAIVPADAVVEADVQVPLLDGRQVPATRLRLTHNPLPPSPDSPAVPPVMPQQAVVRPEGFSEIRPGDLTAWISRLRDGGVWVDRWTSPDLLAQLNAALRQPVDTVICNVLDVDPTVPLNAALAANHPVELMAGLALLAGITAAPRTWIAADSLTPPDWFTLLRNPAATTPRPAGLRMVPLINVYPQADPSLLLYALLNRRLRPGHLPVELGVLIVDSAAAIAVGRLALTGQPMLSVPLAVRDHARRESHFCTVPIGTLLSHVFRRLGLPPVQQLVLRGGDVLRDVHLADDSVVGGTELLVHASSPEPPINPDPCIRCGWCFESCPTYVQPANCLEAAQRNDADLAIRFGIEGCIDCGICSYVCPSHLPILAGIRLMRGRLDG